MRLEYAAGERMFVDFAGDTVPVTDPDTGEIWNAQVFVSVLGASGYLYVEATRSQDLASWLGAHVRALEFYGGAARAVVPDYVARHIIRLLWPTGLCGRRQVGAGCQSWNPERAADSGHINNQSEASQFRRVSSVLQIGLVRDAAVVSESSLARSAANFVLVLISAYRLVVLRSA
jgi:hypothetical protein